MVLPFIIDLEMNGLNGTFSYDHLPVFYFYMDMVKKKKGPIITHERYFNNPLQISHIKSVEAFGSEMKYTIPSISELNSIGKYSISQEFENDLISDYETQMDCWKDILLNENEKLSHLIKTLFNQIEKDYNEKIDAVICFYAPVSLRKVAKDRNIPVIFNERTSFRPPMFVSVGYFDLKENYGKGELEERYKRFLVEAKEKTISILERKEILALLFTSRGLNYLNLIDKIKPSKELGICSVGENAVIFKEGLFTLNELSHEALKIYLPEHIAYRDRTDNRTSLEFILDCKRIASVHSNMSFDAMLLGRTSCSYGNSPFAFMANKGIKDIKENIAPLEFVNFVVFGYFVPWELLRDEEYIRWRLTKPTEIEIYNRHLEYYLTKRGLDATLLSLKNEERLTFILENQNVKTDKICSDNFRGNPHGSYFLGRNIFDCTEGVLLENFYDTEPWGAWTSEKTSRIKFIGNELAYPRSDRKLVFMAHSFHTERPITILFNNMKIAEETVTIEMREYVVPIPVNCIHVGENILEFISSEELICPKEIGMNDDPRKLAIGFDYLRILDYGLDNKISKLESIFNAHDDRLNAHDDRLNTHDDRLNAHDDRLNAHDDRLNAHDGRLEKLYSFIVNTRHRTLYGACAWLFHKIFRRS